MSEPSTDAWFYTANGERIGPVSHERLRELAAEKKLNPRLDLCWTKGMDEWQPAGEIAGLYERTRTDETKDKKLAEKSPFRPTHVDSKLSEHELEHELLNIKWPGSSRRVYLFAVYLLPLLLGAAIALLASFFLNPEDPADVGLLNWALGGGYLVIALLVIFISLERLKNMGMSRWWFLGYFVPFLNLWVNYRSICCPAGYDFHRKLDGVGIFLAILYWGLIVLFIITMVLAIMVMTGLVGGGMFGDFDTLLETWMEKLAELQGRETPVEE